MHVLFVREPKRTNTHILNLYLILKTNQGIPYSDDMGGARASPCSKAQGQRTLSLSTPAFSFSGSGYCEAGFCLDDEPENGSDPAGTFLPLVHQTTEENGNVSTTVVEQPLDFSKLGQKYSEFVTTFIDKSKDGPFFLYVPFSHVHTTNPLQPEEQYAGCGELRHLQRSKKSRCVVLKAVLLQLSRI